MTTGMLNMTKINHASSMIVEDHLKKVLTKTSAKGWKASDNPMLPRCQHSAFGDFPPDYMPKKEKKSAEPVCEDAKKTFSSKSFFQTNSLKTVALTWSARLAGPRCSPNPQLDSILCNFLCV
jgi:hypothetical protein